MAKSIAVPSNFGAVLRRVESGMRKRFEDAIKAITNDIDRAAIEAAIARNDAGEVFRALRIPPSFFYPLERAIDEAYYEGATREGQLIGSQAGAAMTVRFDGRHRRAETFVRETGARLVTEVTRDTQEAVRQIVEQGIREGRNPRDVALDIVGRVPKGSRGRVGGIIGLTSRQASYVANARRELEQGDPNYFTRKARNLAADPLVRKLMEAGKTPTAAQINAIAGSYADNLLRLRGETIARTEAIRALNAGRYEMARQLVESGQMPATAVRFIWDATLSKRTRDSHVHLDNKEVGFDEAFQSPITGALMRFPGDTGLGAPGSETINCRCTMRTRIDRKQLATKRPVGRPTGAGNKPKAIPAPPTPVPPPVAPPVAPPAPPTTFAYEQPATFVDNLDISIYVNRFKLAQMQAWNVEDRAPSYIRAKGEAVRRVHEAMERFSLDSLPLIGDMDSDEQKQRDGTGAYVARYKHNNEIIRLIFNPKSFRATGEAEAYSANITSERAIRKARERVEVYGDSDLMNRLDRRPVAHWTISQEFTNRSYADDVATHEMGHVVHFQRWKEVTPLLDSIKNLADWAPLVSRYAETDPLEYFAEAFNLYLRDDESEYYRIHPTILEWLRANDRKRN